MDGRARRRLPFLAVGYAVVVLLAGSNLPTPLYPLYQRAFGLSPLLVTLVYATYAFTVMPCLLVFGPLSDALGRRRLLLGAVALATVAAAVFALASGTAWLFAAQVVEGVAMGALQGTAVAALVETHPRDDRDHASLVGSAATVGGAAIGPPSWPGCWPGTALGLSFAFRAYRRGSRASASGSRTFGVWGGLR